MLQEETEHGTNKTSSIIQQSAEAQNTNSGRWGKIQGSEIQNVRHGKQTQNMEEADRERGRGLKAQVTRYRWNTSGNHRGRTIQEAKPTSHRTERKFQNKTGITNLTFVQVFIFLLTLLLIYYLIHDWLVGRMNHIATSRSLPRRSSLTMSRPSSFMVFHFTF